MLVVNFFGAPGAGKTTASSGLFHEMKKQWIEAEYIQEYAKELVLSGSSHMLSQQNYIFAKQEHRLNRLQTQVSVAISDSPLLLSSFYAPNSYPDSFHSLVFDFFHTYQNINIFVKRSHEYSAIGRIQNSNESDYIENEMQKFLNMNGIKFYKMTANDASPKKILSWLLKKELLTLPVSSPFVPDFSSDLSWLEKVKPIFSTSFYHADLNNVKTIG